MLRGLSTLNFYADDLEAARRWYTDLLGIEPYFVVPGYIEYRIGDDEDELGIIDARYAPPGALGEGGATVYWHVDDLEAALERLGTLGARPREARRERGHGFVTASFVDPFGNILGVMTNPHWLERAAHRSS